MKIEPQHYGQQPAPDNKRRGIQHFMLVLY